MIILRFILSLLFVILVQLFALIIFLISFPAALFYKWGRVFIYFLVKWVCRLIFLLTFIRVRVEGAEKIPRDGKLIFVSNYPAIMDPLYIIAAFPKRVRILAEEGMFRIPLLGRIMKTLGCIVIPKSGSDSFKQANAIISALRKNEPVWIFAEKPANRDAALKMCTSFGAAVVPVEIQGSDAVLSKKNMLLNPGQIKLIV